MHRWAAPLLLIGLSGCAVAPAASVLAKPRAELSPLSFLSGCWRAETGDGEVVEQWSPVLGDTMLGHSATLRPGKKTAFEFLRIQAADAVVLYAQPGGRSPAVPFTLVSTADGDAVFENPDHDFPQRIRYRRDDDVLRASIGRIGAEPSVTWTYARCARR